MGCWSDCTLVLFVYFVRLCFSGFLWTAFLIMECHSILQGSDEGFIPRGWGFRCLFRQTSHMLSACYTRPSGA